MSSPLRPPPLRPGARVRVVAPAGPFDRESFEKGLAVLRARYSVEASDALFSCDRYLAGTDERRLEELASALRDPGVEAVFAARGGYGAMRLLPDLDLSAGPPRWLVGFSDITALHGPLQRLGRVSVHGPVVTQLGRAPREALDRLWSVLESSTPVAPLSGAHSLVPGAAEGPLVGGNLSVFTRLLGTPYLPSLPGAVLLLEDVGERPYRLDRMWTHLRLAGAFDGLAGIALGQFTGCEEKEGLTAAEVLKTLARETGLPCALGFAVGHEDRNLAVPLGVRVRLDASGGTLAFLEPASAPANRPGVA